MDLSGHEYRYQAVHRVHTCECASAKPERSVYCIFDRLLGSRTVGGKEPPFSCFGRLVVFSSLSSVLPHGSGFLFFRD